MRRAGIVGTVVLVAAAWLASRCGGLAAPVASGAGKEEAPEGKLVFEDRFEKGLANWVSEGPFPADVKDGRLHVKTTEGEPKVGQYLWCRKELPADFRIEYDFTPLSDSGFFLLFFCVQGVKGEDILAPDLFEKYMNHKTWQDYQDFDKYTSPPDRKHGSRIRCYHVSYRRGNQANCNLRKNPGLNLVKTSDISQLLPKDKTVHVALTKKGARILLTVDGRAFMDYTDEGAVDGAFYNGGRFGFRQVYDSEGAYGNVSLYDLTEGKQ
jgi:hypothetical protein